MQCIRSVYKVGVMSMVLGLLLLAPTVQAATFPGANGAIAFSKTHNGKTDIWRMNASGNHAQGLTHAGATTPVWSPDGQKIVFIHAKGWLYSMHSNGSNQRQLTQAFQSKDSSPVWSPDGSRIAFVREETTGQKRSAIFTIRADGSHEVNISGWSENGGYRSPSWAPDGKKIVYEQFTQSLGILLIKTIKNGDTRQLTTITAGTVSRAAWSPNGKKILFNDSPNEVYTIWPDGSHRTVISDGDSYLASWSPDGNRIVFLEDLREDSISISEVDGTVVQVPLQKGVYEEIGSPSWSPDGRQLLFTMAYTTDVGHVSDIFTLSLNEENTMIKLASGQLGEHNWQAKHNSDK